MTLRLVSLENSGCTPKSAAGSAVTRLEPRAKIVATIWCRALMQAHRPTCSTPVIRGRGAAIGADIAAQVAARERRWARPAGVSGKIRNGAASEPLWFSASLLRIPC